MAAGNIQCAYAGMIDLYIRTYTTTFPAINGAWDWHGACFEPMELVAYYNGAQCVGLAGHILNVAQATPTKFTAGQVTATTPPPDNVIGLNYEGNSLFGFISDNPDGLPIYAYQQGLVLDGATHAFPEFQMLAGHALPNATNTQFKAPHGVPPSPCNYQQMFADNILSLVEQGNLMSGGVPYNLVPRTFMQNQIPGVPDISVSGVLPGIGMYTGKGANAVIHGSCANPSSLTDNTFYVATDYLTFAETFGVTWENPPGGFDLNTYMTQTVHKLGNISRGGWLWVNSNVETIEGKTCNGFLILTAPDCSSYTIYRILPLDANSQGWNTFIGTVTAKIDSNGALWLKNVNQNGLVWVSAAKVLKVLPVFPPLPLPDHGDTDNTLKLMRAQRHGE